MEEVTGSNYNIEMFARTAYNNSPVSVETSSLVMLED